MLNKTFTFIILLLTNNLIFYKVLLKDIFKERCWHNSAPSLYTAQLMGHKRIKSFLFLVKNGVE